MTICHITRAIVNKFAERLRELRTERNLTQTQLADAASISQASIAKWESKDRSPHIDFLIVLSKYFGCTTDYLIGVED